MEKIKDLTTYSYKEGIHTWVFDTTRSKLIGFDRNEQLSEEIADWEKHKQFANKYGLLFKYPEDYLSIYLLLSLLREYRILCHPDAQRPTSSIGMLNPDFERVRWIYTEVIRYDRDYDYTLESKGFSSSVYEDDDDQRSLMQTVWDLAAKTGPRSRLYELKNSHHIHQAVICGGNLEAYRCPNYIGIGSEDERRAIIDILSAEERPSLDEVLNHCQFFIVDYKGEDLGYARQMKIYSKKGIESQIENICTEFSTFQRALKDMNLQCSSLVEYELAVSRKIDLFGGS